MPDLERVKRLIESKPYRDTYLENQVRGTISYQIQALREQYQLTQADLATRLHTKQSAISRLESAQESKASVTTLIEIAQEFDVAVLIRFVAYSEFLERASDYSDRSLLATPIKSDTGLWTPRSYEAQPSVYAVRTFRNIAPAGVLPLKIRTGELKPWLKTIRVTREPIRPLPSPISTSTPAVLTWDHMM